MLIGIRNDNVNNVHRRPPPPPLERDDCIIVPGLSRKHTPPRACIKGSGNSAQSSMNEARAIVPRMQTPTPTLKRDESCCTLLELYPFGSAWSATPCILRVRLERGRN